MKILVISLSVLFSVQSFACSCMEMKGNAKEFLKSSKVAFIGIPTAKSERTGAGDEYSKEVKTNFRVVRTFKGRRKRNHIIYSTESDGANCGVHFEGKKGQFLVFAYKRDGKLSTSACSLAGLDLDAYTAELLLELLDV